MNDAQLYETLDEMVDACLDAVGNWDDVLRRAEVDAAPELSPEPTFRRPRRLLTRRNLILAAALLVILFATPAFGLLRDLIGRKDVPFSGKTAPSVVKRDFFDLSQFAPPGMSPGTIASQTRRVGAFRVHGKWSVLYVAPTKKGGYCFMFTNGFGTCRETRAAATTDRHIPGAMKGAVNPDTINLEMDVGGSGVDAVGGDIIAPDAASLTVEYKDHTSSKIPFVYVSKPIDAGFFFYGIPTGMPVAAISVRDENGKLIARHPIGYLPPRVTPPPVTTPTVTRPQRPMTIPTPKPPLQRGEDGGVSVVVGKNGVAVFDMSGATAQVRALLQTGINSDCFRFMRYHEDSPVGIGGGGTLQGKFPLELFGLPAPYDGCELDGMYGRSWPDRLRSRGAVKIAFTARGRRYFADDAAAEDLALFVRWLRVDKIRGLSGSALDSAISSHYGSAITQLSSPTDSLAPDRIGYVHEVGGATFIEYSSTGRRFSVTVKDGKIVAQSVRSLALVY